MQIVGSFTVAGAVLALLLIDDFGRHAPASRLTFKMDNLEGT